MLQDFSHKTKSTEIYIYECVQERTENDAHIFQHSNFSGKSRRKRRLVSNLRNGKGAWLFESMEGSHQI